MTSVVMTTSVCREVLFLIPRAYPLPPNVTGHTSPDRLFFYFLSWFLVFATELIHINRSPLERWS